MYGKPSILACGFDLKAQSGFKTIVELAGLANVPLIWPGSEQAGLTLGQLSELADGTGWGQASKLPRAVIVAGITAARLHGLMGICRQAGMRRALWATLTPTSETWTLNQLLAELERERTAMEKIKKS